MQRAASHSSPRVVSSSQELLPLSIFLSPLSPLEAVTAYLHRDRGLSLTDIAHRLGRSVPCISTAYKHACEKAAGSFIVEHRATDLPVAAFSGGSGRVRMSILELVCTHLREGHVLSFSEIALLLDRDERTVWTCYRRACRKREGSSTRRTRGGLA